MKGKIATAVRESALQTVKNEFNKPKVLSKQAALDLKDANRAASQMKAASDRGRLPFNAQNTRSTFSQGGRKKTKRRKTNKNKAKTNKRNKHGRKSKSHIKRNYKRKSRRH